MTRAMVGNSGSQVFRKPALAALLLSATMLAGCATNKAPQFSYDADVPALPVVPAAVTDDRPRPLHTPPGWTVARGGTAAGTPAGRVENANAAARVEPRREGYYNAIQIYPWSEGALYQVYAAPGQITNIALEPGESLTGAGPIAAGDTARWIIGDTESGSGTSRRVHILVKPSRSDISTNLVVTTDRRTYMIELRAREALYMPSVPAMATPARDPAEELRLAEEEAARLSTVFFQSGQRSATTPDSNMPGLAGLDLGGQPTTQDRHTAFLNGRVDRQTVATDRIMAPASPYILQAGAVIPAAMITGIRSDLPGQITAQVTENVYDSPTDALLLIPQGTRIIGQYDAGVTFGQRRVLLVWNRLILPNGRSIVLERQPGADASGYAGLEDGVDYHWWDLMKAAGLSTLLGIGTELATDDEDRLIRAIRDGAQDTINQAGQQIVQRQLQVAPTLTIRPGFPVRVIVTRDLVLEPYRN